MNGRRFGLVLAVSVLAGACGIGGSSATYEQTHSAAQIMGDASTAMGKLSSFHVSIQGDFASGPATADLDVEGQNYRGKIAGGGLSVRIIVVSGQTYVYGADLAAVLQPTNPQAAAIVTSKAKDKWILVPPGTGPSLTDIVDLGAFATCLQNAAGLSKKSSSTINSKSVVEVDDLAASKFFIATAAPHYPIRFVLSSAEACIGSDTKSETIDLSQFGATFHLVAPPGYVDITTLAGG